VLALSKLAIDAGGGLVYIPSGEQGPTGFELITSFVSDSYVIELEPDARQVEIAATLAGGEVVADGASPSDVLAYTRGMVLPPLRSALALLIVAAGFQAAPPSAGPPPTEVAPPRATDPADLPLTGNLGLRMAGSLGVGGRQIAFITDDRWVSSAGYQVTLWEGAVPKRTFHLDSYNYLAVSTDLGRVYGDREAIDLASATKTPRSGLRSRQSSSRPARAARSSTRA